MFHISYIQYIGVQKCGEISKIAQKKIQINSTTCAKKHSSPSEKSCAKKKCGHGGFEKNISKDSSAMQRLTLMT